MVPASETPGLTPAHAQALADRIVADAKVSELEREVQRLTRDLTHQGRTLNHERARFDVLVAELSKRNAVPVSIH